MSKKTALRIAVVLFIITVFMLGIQIKEDMDENEPKVMEIKRLIAPVHPAIQNMTFRKGGKSYTLNKEVIHLCIFDENGKYYDNNMLIYVALHEVAHVLCDEIGHTDKFHRIHEDLTQKAADMGIFNPSIPLVQHYCEY
jgi:hypothetical protein